MTQRYGEAAIEECSGVCFAGRNLNTPYCKNFIDFCEKSCDKLREWIFIILFHSTSKIRATANTKEYTCVVYKKLGRKITKENKPAFATTKA